MILYDFECPECGNVEERYSDNPESEVCLEPREDGKQCRGVMVQLLSPVRLKTIVRGNHDFADRERERLTKRSNEHYQRAGRDEAIDRSRMQMKKLGLS